MHRMSDYRYRGFTIAVMVWPAINNCYQGAFSIRHTIPRLRIVSSDPEDRPTLLYREGRERGARCETDQAARIDAINRARAWIKSQGD